MIIISKIDVFRPTFSRLSVLKVSEIGVSKTLPASPQYLRDLAGQIVLG